MPIGFPFAEGSSSSRMLRTSAAYLVRSPLYVFNAALPDLNISLDWSR